MTSDSEKKRFLAEEVALFGGPIYHPDPAMNNVPKPASSQDRFSSDLDAFRQKINTCQNCPLGATRTEFVFGVGDPNADLMLIGEAPGRDEDLKGEPFVGRAGHLLDQILAAIDLTREQVFIANVLKCRPPNNRDPSPAEIQQCEPYLWHQIELIKPKLIVALGRIAAMTLLKIEDTLKNMRLQEYTYQGVDLRVTYHPAAMLRNQNFKRPAWEDFKKIRDLYLAKQKDAEVNG